MKTEKCFSRIGFYPTEGVYKRSFVKILFDGLVVYDHRKCVMKTKENKENFLKEFSKDGMVQIVYKGTHAFINIFDVDDVNQGSEAEFSLMVIPTNEKMKKRNRDHFFLSREVKTESDFSAIYVYLIDKNSTDPRLMLKNF